MFSGIVRSRGIVASARGAHGGLRLEVTCEDAAGERAALGDSVAIDGVCLTIAGAKDDALLFDVVPETLARSTLGECVAGDEVNVEFALRLGDRIGGHLVYGHVDATVSVVSITAEGQGKRMRVERPAALAFALVDKAFVALDGVSLTIAAAGDGWFEVALVPETLARTTLGAREAGERLNLEIDPIARYARAS
jgi:riboflavin synthase